MSKGDGALNSYLREVGQVPLLTPDEEVELVILPVKNAVSPAIQSVFELHVFLHVEENERAEFFPLASSRRVVADSVRIVHSRVGLLANLLAFLVFPILPAGEIAPHERFKIWLQR
jgi:hypothetical protein